MLLKQWRLPVAQLYVRSLLQLQMKISNRTFCTWHCFHSPVVTSKNGIIKLRKLNYTH